MAVEESEHGTFRCTIHDYHAVAAMDPEGTGEAMVPTSGGFTPGCDDCEQARRWATEHARGERLDEEH